MKADIRWLDRPDVFRVNQCDAHSDHSFYESASDCALQQQTLKTILKRYVEIPLFCQCKGTSGSLL